MNEHPLLSKVSGFRWLLAMATVMPCDHAADDDNDASDDEKLTNIFHGSDFHVFWLVASLSVCSHIVFAFFLSRYFHAVVHSFLSTDFR